MLCGLFSSCREQGLLSSCGAQAALLSGFSCRGPHAQLWLLDLFIFSWRIIALQYSVVFCHISTGISHRYTYIPSLLNLPPHPSPVGFHRATDHFKYSKMYMLIPNSLTIPSPIQLFSSRIDTCETSLVVQWLRVHLPTQGTQSYS